MEMADDLAACVERRSWYGIKKGRVNDVHLAVGQNHCKATRQKSDEKKRTGVRAKTVRPANEVKEVDERSSR